ncbi:MAG: PDZ domain-containing protein [Planctomycetaceae bacterium]|nr:PDZ domain-containing protein [Planctomycetaceae bacterium]
MLSKSFHTWIALGLIGAFAPAASALGQEATSQVELPGAAPGAAPLEVTLRAPVGGEVADAIALIVDGAQAVAGAIDEAPTGEYYIGISLGELPAVARAQLKLEHGVVVDDVIEGSPAAKADFKPHDILIRVGESKIEQPADIVKAVEEAKDKEMRIVVLRDGKEMALTVKPTKRPKSEAGEGGEAIEARLPESAIQRIEEALRELKSQDASRALGIYFPRPGVVAQRSTTRMAELPKNMKISIVREGDGPAKIHVEREGKSWDTTDDKLGELPEDVRGQVERMLSKVFHPMLAARARALVVPKSVHAYSPGTPGAPAVVPYPGTPGTQATPGVAPPQASPRTSSYRSIQSAPSSVESKIDQILKKLNADDDQQALDRLREEVERLRKEVDSLKNK